MLREDTDTVPPRDGPIAKIFIGRVKRNTSDDHIVAGQPNARSSRRGSAYRQSLPLDFRRLLPGPLYLNATGARSLTSTGCTPQIGHLVWSWAARTNSTCSPTTSSLTTHVVDGTQACG